MIQPERAVESERELVGCDPRMVEEAVRALSAALRGFRLYEAQNPMRERFIGTLREKLRTLWEELPELRLQIEEKVITWEGHAISSGGESGPALPFLFYKDGIREITLLPGFEGDEVEPFLAVLTSAAGARSDEDDLVTLLWQEEFGRLRYRVVEPIVFGEEEARSSTQASRTIDPQEVRSAASEPAGIRSEDFRSTPYFLDESELRHLHEEIRLENERDVWQDVVRALFDRLEDGQEGRQLQILEILSELLPSALASGRVDRASSILRELAELARRPDLFGPSVLRAVRDLFELLGTEAVLSQLESLLQAASAALDHHTVTEFLGYLPPSSILNLMWAAERAERPDVRRAFEATIERMVQSDRSLPIELLEWDDPERHSLVLRWIARIEVGVAVDQVLASLQHPEPGVRVAAIEALIGLRAAIAAPHLQRLLADEAREVRTAAARALAALEITHALPELEQIISSRRIWEAERAELLVLFEAYGHLAGGDGVGVLDRILNPPRWSGRARSSEVRACAALALARVAHPEALVSLRRASNDRDPIVRTAVARALREGR